jgi:predicted HTH domain antitoxin
MHTHALTTAMTLYRSGTLTLAQAATRAGRSEAELRAALKQHGIPIRDESGATVTAGTDSPARAD